MVWLTRLLPEGKRVDEGSGQIAFDWPNPAESTRPPGHCLWTPSLEAKVATFGARSPVISIGSGARAVSAGFENAPTGQLCRTLAQPSI